MDQNKEIVVIQSQNSVSESQNLPEVETTVNSDIVFTTSTRIDSKAPTRGFLSPKVVRTGQALTKKNRAFLELLCAGKDTVEAYKLAGYKGSTNASYQLRYQLKEELKELLELEGIDRTGLKIKAKQLLDMGLPPDLKYLSPKMYLEALKFVEKLIGQEKGSDIKITPFVVHGDVTINEGGNKNV